MNNTFVSVEKLLFNISYLDLYGVIIKLLN